MNAPDPNARLSETLASWRVDPPLDPNFRPAVWQRIRRQTPDTWAAYLRTHLLQWSLAAGLAVVAAGFAGHSLAQAKIESHREQMALSYLGDLDPRVLANLRPEK